MNIDKLVTVKTIENKDFSDEKHTHIMEVLKQRAEAGNNGEAVSAEQQDAAAAADVTASSD